MVSASELDLRTFLMVTTGSWKELIMMAVQQAGLDKLASHTARYALHEIASQ